MENRLGELKNVGADFGKSSKLNKATRHYFGIYENSSIQRGKRINFQTLVNYELMEGGFPPAIIKVYDRDPYYESLNQFIVSPLYCISS
jgi:hypothetical protein